MYDFSSVKAEFIASVPGKFERNNHKWGLARLKQVLKNIPASEKGELFAQVIPYLMTISPPLLIKTLSSKYTYF